MRRALALLLFMGLFLPWRPAPAYACSCIPFEPRQFLEFNVLVLTGRITQIERPTSPSTSADPIAATVAVERYMKGAGPQTVMFRSPLESPSCGFLRPEDRGRPYLLFLQSGQGKDATGAPSSAATGGYISNLCSGNIPLDTPQGQERLAAVMAITGPGVLPQTPPPDQPGAEPLPSRPARSWMPVLVIVGGVILLFTILGAGGFRMTQGKH